MPANRHVLFLGSDVLVEPLVCSWHAWPHLLAPATLALNLAQRYLPLLESFIAKPQVHAAAMKDPRLFGGPFVALAPTQVAAARELLRATREQAAGLLQLARDLRACDEWLQLEAQGGSLNALYERVPASLRGLIELAYDVRHRASLRLREELLSGEWPLEVLQQIRIARASEAERAFFMSTPRLIQPDALTLQLPFADSRLDILARARNEGVAPAELEQLGLNSQQREMMLSRFFTAEPPRRPLPAPAEQAVRVRHFGHACVLIETACTAILVDPTFATDPGGDGRLTIADLPERIDYVVITHAHQDHCSPEHLLQLRPRVGRILVPRNHAGSLADPSLRLILQQLGFARIDALEPFMSVPFADGEILALPFQGEHADLDIHSKQAVLVTAARRRLLFLVDSDGHEPRLHERILRRIGTGFDALFIGMESEGAPLSWLYGPLLANPLQRGLDESRRLAGSNCERAWRIVRASDARRVYVYAMGQEPWMKYMMGLAYGPDSPQLRESHELLKRCRAEGIEAQSLRSGFTLWA